MEANRLFESSLTLVLKLRNLDVCWRKMRMFYFIMEGLTIFKNKSKGLREKNSQEDNVPLERRGILPSLCKVL